MELTYQGHIKTPCLPAVNPYLPKSWREMWGGCTMHIDVFVPLLTTWLLNWANLFPGCQPIKTGLCAPANPTHGTEQQGVTLQHLFHLCSQVRYATLHTFWSKHPKGKGRRCCWGWHLNAAFILGEVYKTTKKVALPCFKLTTPIHQTEHQLSHPFHITPFT